MKISIKKQLEILSKLPNFDSIIKSKLIGLEKESLRYFHNGELANTHHPKAIGASLTHKNITTDYAESQLELITRPHNNALFTLEELHDIHSFIYSKIGSDQILWPLSMPSNLPRPKDIMTAKFGASNQGQIKELYRSGLGYRYGKIMQLICGIHFNFSFSKDFWQEYFVHIENTPNWNQSDVNNKYMATIRNYMRISWLITYLFGASPIINSKFITSDTAISNYLKPFKNHCYIADFGTSLRSSSLGYHNKPKVNSIINYNSLEEYAKNIYQAVTTIDPEFEEIGLYRGNKQIQINCNILQIENEYYGIARPKPDEKYNHTPIFKTLLNKGIHYLELRNFDLNPFSPIGIDIEQCLFIEAVMYYCLLSESPEFDLKERIHIKKNIETVALLGRQPDLLLKDKSTEKPLQDLANNIFAELKNIAHYLDHIDNSTKYSMVMDKYQEYINDSELTPSAKINTLLKSHDIEYTQYFLSIAKENLQYFKTNPLSAEKLKYYENLASDSLTAKNKLEEKDRLQDFNINNYLADYYSRG